MKKKKILFYVENSSFKDLSTNILQQQNLIPFFIFFKRQSSSVARIHYNLFCKRTSITPKRPLIIKSKAESMSHLLLNKMEASKMCRLYETSVADVVMKLSE